MAREQIIESVDRSLQRLGTDHIDLLQVNEGAGTRYSRRPQVAVVTSCALVMEPWW
jgi:aryl-alcohol dehydrogenase-like predicted oxidoreductase